MPTMLALEVKDQGVFIFITARRSYPSTALGVVSLSVCHTRAL